MAAVTIGDRIEQNRAFAFFKNFTSCGAIASALPPADCNHRHVRRASVRDSCLHRFVPVYVEAHRFAFRLAAHTVEVIVEVDNQRQSTTMGFVPEFFELVHRRKAQAFPDRAAS